MEGSGVTVLAEVGLAAIGGAALKAFAQFMERDILARAIWAEARGEGPAGMLAVANVIMNRVADRRWPNTVRGVILQPLQFSAFNDGDPNKALALAADNSTPLFPEALAIARAALNGEVADLTFGANHYFNPSVQPDWAQYMERVAAIGRHEFYRS